MTNRIYSMLAVAALTIGLGSEAMAQGRFKDFSVQVNNETGSILETTEQVAGTAISFGLMGEGDDVVRCPSTHPDAFAIVDGTFHGEHGLTGMKVKIFATGALKITIGNCTYGGHDVKILNSDNQEIKSATTQASCWKGGHTSTTTINFTGKGWITVVCPSYCAYLAAEAAENVPTAYNVTYKSAEGQTIKGEMPNELTVDEGYKITMPKLCTAIIMKEVADKEVTMRHTGWTDGEKTYEIGEEVTVEKDMELSAVAEEIVAPEGFGKKEIVMTYDFQTCNGANKIAWEGEETMHLWVGEAESEGFSVPEPMTVNVQNGKLNNTNHTDWCQANAGTVLYIPFAKVGTRVEIETYGTTATDTKINDTVGFDVTLSEATAGIMIVVGSDAQYIRRIVVTIPAEEEKTTGNVELTTPVEKEVKYDEYYNMGGVKVTNKYEELRYNVEYIDVTTFTDDTTEKKKIIKRLY